MRKGSLRFLNTEEREKLSDNRKVFDGVLSYKNTERGQLLILFIAVIELALVINNLFHIDTDSWIWIARFVSYFCLFAFCVLGYLIIQKQLRAPFLSACTMNRLTLLFVSIVLLWCGFTGVLDVYAGGYPIIFFAELAGVACIIYVKPLATVCVYIPLMATYLLIDALVVNDAFTAEYAINLILFFSIVVLISITRYYSRVRDFLESLSVDESRSSLISANQKLIDLNNQLEQISMTDRLTGLRNRWAYNENLEAMFERCKESGIAMSLVIFDLDNFKLINDRLGHSVGDKCLISVADTLDHHLAWSNAYRYGGEEFIMLFEGLPEQEVFGIAEDIRVKIETTRHTDRDLCITVSGGIYTKTPDEETDIEKYLVNADRALYVAKINGKNRIECYQGAAGVFSDKQRRSGDRTEGETS